MASLSGKEKWLMDELAPFALLGGRMAEEDSRFG